MRRSRSPRRPSRARARSARTCWRRTRSARRAPRRAGVLFREAHALFENRLARIPDARLRACFALMWFNRRIVAEGQRRRRAEPPERMAIAPTGADADAKPAADVLPAGFVTDGETIPMMGKHYLSPANPEFTGGTFTASPIFGYYGGHLIFVESMVTLAYLNGKPSLSKPLAQPARYEKAGAYPTEWSVSYDAAAHRYDVAFGGMVAR